MVQLDFSALLENLVAGVVIHDAAGVVIFANDAAQHMMQLSAGQMLGRPPHDPFWKLIDLDGTPLPLERYPAHRTLFEGRPVHERLGVCHPTDPRRAPSWLICDTYTDGVGQGLKIVVMITDITREVHARRLAEQSEERFRLLYTNVNDALILFGAEGQALGANPAACKLFRGTEAQIIAAGRSGIVDLADPRGDSLVRDRLASGAAAGQVRMRRLDGSVFEAEVSSASYQDAKGARHVGKIIRDVTERVERDRAIQANKAISELCANVSHELRTPLNAVIGLSEVLVDSGELQPSQARLATHISDAGHHLLRLVEDLLDFAALDTDQVSVRLETVDAWEQVKAVHTQLSRAALDRGVTFQLHDGAPRSSPAFVSADPVRLRQILWNLFTNAIKYNKAGGRVDVRIHADGGPMCRIDVSDTGVGLSDAQLARLFERHQRLGQEHGNIQGAGIGLNLSLRLARLQGGEITATSQPGKGSLFSLRLPGAPDPRKAAPSRPPSTRASAQLLYVDDDPVNRLVMQAITLQLGWSLVEAESGPQALELLRRSLAHPPAIELMLVDLRMLGMDGYQVLRHVRGSPELAGIPCVAVSAFGSAHDADAALRHGFDGFLHKPLSVVSVRAEVNRLLDVTASRPGDSPEHGK